MSVRSSIPAMHCHKTIACLLLVPLFIACKKDEARKPPAEPPSPTQPMGNTTAVKAREGAALPSRPTPPNLGDVKALLTEDKLARFVTYQKQLASVSSEAMGMGMSAYQKAGTDQKKLEKAVVADDRFAKIAAASKAALEKSGLTQDEVSKLTTVLTPYYARIYAMSNLFGKPADAKVAEAKGEQPKPGSMEAARLKAQEGRMERLETTRKEFADQYGADALERVKKHEPEFMAINEKMMGAAMSAFGNKK
jgi:hypothetical protein